MAVKYKSISVGDTEYKVPQYVHRVDTGSTHGWQVQYSTPFKYFGDKKHGGSAKKALQEAIKYLGREMLARPRTAVPLRQNANANKKNDLPRGISGPNIRRRNSNGEDVWVLSVGLFRVKGKPRNTDVRISVGQYTRKQFKAALATAIAMRERSMRERNEVVVHSVLMAAVEHFGKPPAMRVLKRKPH